eukprot:11359999-Alexandrium_andersonii.AAC.1
MSATAYVNSTDSSKREVAHGQDTHTGNIAVNTTRMKKCMRNHEQILFARIRMVYEHMSKHSAAHEWAQPSTSLCTWA